MDSACYDSVNGNIIGVRGGRAYQCNATTGAVNASPAPFDYQQLAFGQATVVFANNLCYAACMSTPHYDVAAFGTNRNFYRLNTLTLQPAQTFNFKTNFGLPLNNAALESGLMVMRPFGTGIFAMGFKSAVNPSLNLFNFSAIDPTTYSLVDIGFYGYPSFGIGVVGGETFTFWARQDANTIASYGWGGTGFNENVADAGRGYYATEYAPVQNRVYVTREFQFIDVYDNATAPNFILTIDTTRSTFNGVNIKFNSVDGLLYIAGGADNTVIVLNPAGNSFVVKTGFDLPFDFVFTPSKKFAVQLGSTPLKEIT